MHKRVQRMYRIRMGLDALYSSSHRHGKDPVGANAAAPAQGSEPMPGVLEGVDARSLPWTANTAVSCAASLPLSIGKAWCTFTSWVPERWRGFKHMRSQHGLRCRYVSHIDQRLPCPLPRIMRA